MSTPGNGDYRLRDLERRMDALERRMDRLDEQGSRKTGEIVIQLRAVVDDVKALDANLTWLIRSIAAVVFIAVGAVLIAILSGVSGG